MAEIAYDVQRICSMIPHRFPFLLVDRVISVTGGETGSRVGRIAVGIKNVTFNEPYFAGHFPDLPVMPGVLQIEAMAQLAAISYYRNDEPMMDFFIASVQNARFRKPVVPGDVLRITSEIVKDRGSMMQVATQCHVDGDMVAEATILAAVVPRSERSKK